MKSCALQSVSNTIVENSRKIVVSQTTNHHSQSLQLKQTSSTPASKVSNIEKNPYASNNVVKCYHYNAKGYKSNVCLT